MNLIKANQKTISISLSVIVSFLFVYAFAVSTTTISSNGLTTTGNIQAVNITATGTTTLATTSIIGNLGVGTSSDSTYGLRAARKNWYFDVNNGQEENHVVLDTNSGFKFSMRNALSAQTAYMGIWDGEFWALGRGVGTYANFGIQGDANLSDGIHQFNGFDIPNGTGQVVGMNLDYNLSNLNSLGDGYTAIKLNITDAQAGAGGARNLMDLQTDGSSKFIVMSNGNTSIGGGYPSRGRIPDFWGALNDMTIGGDYNGTIDGLQYQITANSGTPDTVDWTDSNGHSATGIPITAGVPISLSYGVTITFANSTGHNGELWIWEVTNYNFQVTGSRMRFRNSLTPSFYTGTEINDGSFDISLYDTATNQRTSQYYLGQKEIWMEAQTASSSNWTDISDSPGGGYYQFNSARPQSGLAMPVFGFVFNSDFSTMDTLGGAYTGLTLNVTNTVDPDIIQKNLFNVQSDGISKFKIDSSGNITVNGRQTITSGSSGTGAVSFDILNSSGAYSLSVSDNSTVDIYNTARITNATNRSFGGLTRDGFTKKLSLFNVVESPSSDPNTKLLMHFDGTSGSKVFVDEIGNNITDHSNASITNTPVKFGTGAGYFNGSDYLTVPYSSDFNLSGGTWTLEAWFNANSFASSQAIISKDTYGANFDWVISLSDSTHIAIATDYTLQNLTVVVPEMSTSTWYHVAIVDNAGTVTIYLNGVAYGSGVLSVTDVSQNFITIGCSSWNYPGAFFNGYIDELRVSNGVARWTSNFTPEVSAYANPINWAQENALTVDSRNNIGIGTTSPMSKLTVNQTINTDLLAYENRAGFFNNVIADLTATNGTDAWAVGNKINVEIPTTNSSNLGATRSSILGQDVYSLHNGSGNIFQVRGGSYYAEKTGTGNADYIIGLTATGANSSSSVSWISGAEAGASIYANNGVTTSATDVHGALSLVQNFSLGSGRSTIVNAYGISSQISSTVLDTGSANIYNAYGLYVDSPIITGGGAIGKNYGLYIKNQTGATSTSYAIYSENGNNYFGGSGTSTFAGYIDVLGASTATSTFTGNLWVKGTLRAATSYTGDLIFANAFRFYEDPTPINNQLATGTQSLKLTNQKNEDIFKIDENGNLTIKGTLLQATTTEQSVISQGLTWILDQFKTIGVTIVDGVISAKEFVAEKITGKQICVEGVCFDRNDAGVLRDIINEKRGAQITAPSSAVVPSPDTASTTNATTSTSQTSTTTGASLPVEQPAPVLEPAPTPAPEIVQPAATTTP